MRLPESLPENCGLVLGRSSLRNCKDIFLEDIGLLRTGDNASADKLFGMLETKEYNKLVVTEFTGVTFWVDLLESLENRRTTGEEDCIFELGSREPIMWCTHRLTDSFNLLNSSSGKWQVISDSQAVTRNSSPYWFPKLVIGAIIQSTTKFGETWVAHFGLRPRPRSLLATVKLIHRLASLTTLRASSTFGLPETSRRTSLLNSKPNLKQCRTTSFHRLVKGTCSSGSKRCTFKCWTLHLLTTSWIESIMVWLKQMTSFYQTNDNNLNYWVFREQVVKPWAEVGIQQPRSWTAGSHTEAQDQGRVFLVLHGVWMKDVLRWRRSIAKLHVGHASEGLHRPVESENVNRALDF